MQDDPYLDMINAQIDNILMMYRLCAAKRPVMLFDIDDEKIYAYPYKEFLADLNARSQRILKKQYREAQRDNAMVLFIRDTQHQKFKSYSLPLD